jgi:hypothetical protein
MVMKERERRKGFSIQFCVRFFAIKRNIFFFFFFF